MTNVAKFPFEKTVERVPNDARQVSYLNDADTAEALAYGYGVPPEPVLTEVRCLWWRLRAQGVRLPAERRIIVHHRVWL